MKIKIRIETIPMPKCNCVYVIIRDPASGKVSYTVHRISLFGFKETTVVGRELPLRLARELVADIKEDRSVTWPS